MPRARAAVTAAAVCALALGCNEAAVCPAPPLTRCADATSTDRLAVLAALRGEEPSPDELVLTHRLDGTVIARAHTDADGCAQLTSEPGALVTVATLGQYTRRLATTRAPTTDVLVVHLEPPALDDEIEAAPDCHAGTLRIDDSIGVNPELSYSVDLGCARHSCVGSVWRPQYFGALAVLSPLPIELPVPGFAVGRDGLVDVRVTRCGWYFGQLIDCATAATRTGPDATLDVRSLSNWNDVVRGSRIGSDWVESDGMKFPRDRTDDGEFVPLGDLRFDHYAVLRSRTWVQTRQISITLRRAPAALGAPAVTDEDFLPEIDAGPLVEDAAGRALRWPIPAFPFDAFTLQLWADPNVAWVLVLPPDIDHLTLPDDPEVAWAIQDGTLTAIDDDDRPDFGRLLGSDLYLDDEFLPWSHGVPTTTTTRLRTTSAKSDPR